MIRSSFVVLLMAACSFLQAEDPEIVKFTIVGDLLDPWGGQMNWVSEDGSLFGGTNYFGGGFRWSDEAGLDPVVSSAIRDMANDGTLIGSNYFPMLLGDTLIEVNAASYHNGEEWIMIGPIAGTLPDDPNFYQSAWAIAADTMIIAGMYWHDNSRTTAFVWTPDDPDGELLPDNGYMASSRPNDMSADGSVIVGWAQVDSGNIQVGRVAHAWFRNELTQEYELTFLGALGMDEGWWGGEAYGCSENGKIIVGRSGPRKMFVWTSSDGMVNLGIAPGHDPTRASATGMAASSDTTIVGFARPIHSEWGRTAIIWTEESGIIFLKDSLESLGLEDDFEDWELLQASSITPDGRFIVGSALGLAGIMQPFILEFIPPSAPTDLASELYNDADGLRIELNWFDDPSNNEFNYHLQRRAIIADSTSDWTTLAHPDSSENMYTDTEVYFANGVEWEYRLRAENPVGESDWVEIMTASSTDEIATGLPPEFSITGAYPNPFNPTTTIQYDIPKLMQTKIALYSITGTELAVLHEGQLTAGNHNLQLDLSGYSSGVYLVRIISGDMTDVQKLTLIK
ncbi:MAG: T9SS type A sorting domain-containing protein [Candidatus Marinimicrobia bacterium]|nr:T9SS type A sorting domain-containing protein [FCB group bacterium]MBL7024665.1 T9SS type A sorting domain-containing protein [Candidatus Neomarinimicrobiota bacterium]